MRRVILLLLTVLVAWPVLAEVTVTLIANRPEYCTVGTGFPYTWTVTGGTPQGVNCLEWETGTSATPPATPFRNNTANTFSAPYGKSVPAPATTGYIYVRAHAKVGGQDYFSAVRTVRVNPVIEITSAPISYFQPVAPGSSVTIGWKVYGATPTHNHIEWVATSRASTGARPPFNQRSQDCPTQPSQATITMPAQGADLVYFQIYAVVDGREYRSDERSFDIRMPKITITRCPTDEVVGMPIAVIWSIDGWNAGPGNRIVWGGSPAALTNASANAPVRETCTASVTAPATVGKISLRVRADINGQTYESEVKTVTVLPRLALVNPPPAVPPFPPEVPPLTPIPVTWSVAGGTPAGTNCLEWGSSATALTNRSQHAFTAPYTVTLPGSNVGTLYLRIRTAIDGTEYVSPVHMLTVRPAITVTSCPTTVAPGGPIRVTWTVSGGTPTENRLLWGTRANTFTDRTSEILTSPAEATITSPATPGTVYMRILAAIGDSVCHYVERTVKVQAPVLTIVECPKTVKAGETFAVAWTVTGGTPEEVNTIEWGADGKKFPLKTANATGKAPYKTTLTAPGAGVIYLRARAAVHGIDYYSTASAVTVVK
jgi:hypothetical protein